MTPGVIRVEKLLLGLDVTKVIELSGYSAGRQLQLQQTNSEGKLPDEAQLIVVERLQDCCLGLSGRSEKGL